MTNTGRQRRFLAAVAVAASAVTITCLGWWAKDREDVQAQALNANPGPALAASAPDAKTVEHGAYIARLGNCAGCHTAQGGQSFAGGRGIATPFGTVFAGNLTPEATTGLGLWTAQDLWNALHHGRGRDGRALLPAFPYTEFTRISRADSDALWAFLRSLPPVVQARPAHRLRFPYNTALALAAWRAVYFKPAAFEPDPARGGPWNRGAYLATGLGHCAACHAPRDRWGGRGEVMSGARMAGAGWWAPSLVDGAFDAQQMATLLLTGQSTLGTAMGPMAEVVVQSTQHWSLADVQALSTYFASQASARPALPRAGATAPALQPAAQLYADRCADCHGAQGEGVAGIYPPLADNPSVLQPDPVNLVQAVRLGGFAPATRAHPRPFGMPPFDFSDKVLAELLTHLRQSWGHAASPVTELQVLQTRQ